MKKVIIINGAMGVGKTTVSRALCEILPSNVFLDGDWCWDSHPFIVNDETIELVKKNITTLLNNFIGCSAYQFVVFCWVLHDKLLLNDICSKIDKESCNIHTYTLTCSETELLKRLNKDISCGVRKIDIIPRALSRLKSCNLLETQKVDVEGQTAEQVAASLKKMIMK